MAGVSELCIHMHPPLLLYCSHYCVWQYDLNEQCLNFYYNLVLVLMYF